MAPALAGIWGGSLALLQDPWLWSVPHLTSTPLLTELLSSKVVIYLISTAFYNVYFHPLSKFPGPKLHAASHIPISLIMLQGQYLYKIKELHEIYGDVVRVAPNEVHFSSGGAIRDLTTKPGMPKSPRFYMTNPGQSSSIVTVQRPL